MYVKLHLSISGENQGVIAAAPIKRQTWDYYALMGLHAD
jgi:hypothetical protein